MLNKIRVSLLLLIGLVIAAPAVADERPRLIVLTDIGTEPDDIQSLVRLLTYSNEIEIEGLIASTSRHLHDRVYPELIAERVNAYGQVLANLRAHDPLYPDAAYLTSKIKAGLPLLGMDAVGKGKDSEGSRHIIEVVDRADHRPVWISIWGGAATLSQALWTVKQTRSPKEVAKFIAKLRVYSISDQDDSGPWARATFPQLFWIASIHGPSNYQLAGWTGISADTPGADPEPVSKKWLRSHVQTKGPLGALYPNTIFIMEGDTPSFLNLVGNGLSVPEQPDWGGWGGRWVKPSPDFGHWADTIDSVAGIDGKTHSGNRESIWRWRGAYQNDFAARMLWSVTPEFANANHAPKLVVNGQAGSAPVTFLTCPGAPVSLSAHGTSDPDGNALTYRWWRYNEVLFLVQTASLSSPDELTTIFTMPEWTQNYELPLLPLARVHILLEVSDDGAPKLTRYRRIVIDVATDGRTLNGKPCPKIEQRRAQGLSFATGAMLVSDAAYSTHDTSIGEMLDDPRLLPILERYVPQIIDAGKTSDQGRKMVLRGVMNFIPGLTAETLDAMDVELARIPAKP
jgi:Protein of unknown function (DUF1593)